MSASESTTGTGTATSEGAGTAVSEGAGTATSEGAGTATSEGAGTATSEGAVPGEYYDPHQYMRETVQTLAHVRDKYGDSIELLHDVHERLEPIDAVNLAKQLEQFNLFYLEDLLAPEQVDWFRHIRNQAATPLAMGELFNNPMEWNNASKLSWGC